MVGEPSSLFANVTGVGPRIVLVHGFTQNRRCWGPAATDLERDHEIVAVDAPGHGRSCTVKADLGHSAALLAATGGEATYLGYSMGGRICLQLALSRPDLVRRLVLVGASPGIADPGDRHRRRAGDEALAERIGQLGVPEFIAEWLDQALFAGLDAATACLNARLDNTVDGLQSSLRLAGTGSQPSLWDELDELEMPVLLVTGTGDEKFSAVARDMAARIGPNARHVLVPNAGHTAHLENPDGFLTLVRDWLRTTSSTGA